jgi:membrane protease YdiL (CAAX protease family)
MSTSPPDATGAPRAENTTLSGRPSPPEPPSTLHYILFGPDGLRAGWSIVLFLALYASLWRCLYPIEHALLHAQPIHGGLLTARQTLDLEGAGIVALLIAMWLLARLERRRATAYGFAPRNRARYFFGGLMWGVALLSLLVFLLRACGLLVFDTRLLNGPSIAHYGLLWFAAFLLVALKEELFSRGYLQFTLTRGLRSIYRWVFGARHANALGFWTAALALSYLFGAGHSGNTGESPIGLFAAGLFGLLFCFSLWRTGSLWWAIGFHTAWDWAQSFLYGVPDSGLIARGHLFAAHAAASPWLSGGVTGPEGSVLFLPVAVVTAGVIAVSLPHTHNGYLPANTEDDPPT